MMVTVVRGLVVGVVMIVFGIRRRRTIGGADGLLPSLYTGSRRLPSQTGQLNATI